MLCKKEVKLGYIKYNSIRNNYGEHFLIFIHSKENHMVKITRGDYFYILQKLTAQGKTFYDVFQTNVTTIISYDYLTRYFTRSQGLLSDPLSCVPWLESLNRRCQHPRVSLRIISWATPRRTSRPRGRRSTSIRRVTSTRRDSGQICVPVDDMEDWTKLNSLSYTLGYLSGDTSSRRSRREDTMSSVIELVLKDTSRSYNKMITKTSPENNDYTKYVVLKSTRTRFKLRQTKKI